MLLKAAAAAAAVLALAACGGGGGGKTSTESSLSPGCEVAVANRALTRFLDAVSSGDRGRIAASLSPASDFVRLTVETPGGRFTTTSREGAIAYLAGRHRYRERLRLLQLVVARGIDANHDTFQAVIARTATDIGRDIAAGDGSIDCLKESISRLRLVPSAQS